MLANVNTIALEGIDGRLDEMNKNGNDNIEQDSFMDEKKYAYEIAIGCPIWSQFFYIYILCE